MTLASQALGPSSDPCLAGAIIPAATAIIVSAVDADLRELASAGSIFLFQQLGYAAAPCVSRIAQPVPLSGSGAWILQSTSCLLPPASYLLPPTSCLLPPTSCLLLPAPLAGSEPGPVRPFQAPCCSRPHVHAHAHARAHAHAHAHESGSVLLRAAGSDSRPIRLIPSLVGLLMHVPTCLLTHLFICVPRLVSSLVGSAASADLAKLNATLAACPGQCDIPHLKHFTNLTIYNSTELYRAQTNEGEYAKVELCFTVVMCWAILGLAWLIAAYPSPQVSNPAPPPRSSPLLHPPLLHPSLLHPPLVHPSLLHPSLRSLTSLRLETHGGQGMGGHAGRPQGVPRLGGRRRAT